MNTIDRTLYPPVELSNATMLASGLHWTATPGPDGERAVWYYGAGDAHHPNDRIGGPFRVDHVYLDYGNTTFYLYADTSVGHFPLYIVVGTDYGESDALETLCELYPGVRVPADMIAEWEDDHGEDCHYNGDGVLVDLDYMTGGKEVFLSRVDLAL